MNLQQRKEWAERVFNQMNKRLELKKFDKVFFACMHVFGRRANVKKEPKVVSQENLFACSFTNNF
jgi:hypothetical protein